jgi:uncharacterized protein (TIGR02271 family)
MISTDQIPNLLDGGGNVLDRNGDKIGGIGQIFVDDQSGRPEWVTAKTGLFGTGESFVPLAESTVTGEDITVPYDKDMVKDAPRLDDVNGHLSESEEADLYSYYGLNYSDARSDSGLPAGESGGQSGVGYETVGEANADDDTSYKTDDAMTRSEEQLHVGTEKREAGRARLRKYIVTENVTKTVPVSHEEVRIEREPITDANRDEALSGPDLSEGEHEVTLEDERVVVDKETVPVERVRLDKDTVTDEEQVNEEVRREEIDTSGVEGDGDLGGR